MNTHFLVWGNGNHEYSLNNRNPKSKRSFYNKRDYSLVTVGNKKIDQIFCKDNCLLIIIEGEIYKRGFFNWEIENFENEDDNTMKNIRENPENIKEEKLSSDLFSDDKPLQVKNIQFGMNHVLILSEKKNVYTWGDNYYGQLGINNQMIPLQSNPTKVIFPDSVKIESIFAFKNNSFAIDINGCLWGWGKYEYIKQDNPRNVFSPIKIFDDDKKIKNLFFMDDRIILEMEEPPKIQDNNQNNLANTTNASMLRTTMQQTLRNTLNVKPVANNINNENRGKINISIIIMF